MSVKDQLLNAKTIVREKLFFHRLCYDLKIAAIAENFNLQIYEVEVDDAGYDIIVDGGLKQRRFQLKTRLLPGGARQWLCHAKLLCPTPEQGSHWELLEWSNREAWGYNGGLILADVSWADHQTPIVTYKYTDLAILMAFRDGFSSCSRKSDVAKTVCSKTLKNPFAEKYEVQIPQSMLVQPKTHKDLLGLMGFNIQRGIDYNHCFLQAYSRRLRGKQNHRNDDSFKATFFRTLAERIN